MNKTISYAQNREDLILAGFFDLEKPGFYVDVGANSPEVDSVTKLFYEHGWSGVNIEPIKRHFLDIERLRPRDTNLNIGISDKPGKLNLREYDGTGLSTFSSDMKEEHENNPNHFTEHYNDYDVEVKTLKKALESVKVTSIDFMKIDVEGFEREVLIGNDWEVFRPQVICIEANHIHNDWHAILKDNEYEKVFFDGLNEYFADTRKEGLKDRFSYVDAVISKEPIVNYRMLDEIEVGRKAQDDLTSLQTEIELKNQQIAHLEATLSEVLPLRRHFKRQLKSKLKNINNKITNKLNPVRPYEPTEAKENNSLNSLIDYDKANFAKFKEYSKIPPLTKAYNSTKDRAFRALSKLLRIAKV